MSTKNAYKPDYMLMRLQREFSELLDPEVGTGIENRFLFGVFFHEWIHYFHNVSTMAGLSAFASTTLLWDIFHKSNNEGIIVENDEDKNLIKRDIKRTTKFLSFIRGEGENNDTKIIINKKPYESIKILEVEIKELQLDKDETVHSLICTLEIIDQNFLNEKFIVEVKPLHLFENIAWLLEKKLVNLLAIHDQTDNRFEKIDLPEIIPYRIIELILNYYIPSIDDEDCIHAMLAALHHSDPLFFLINPIVEIIKKSKDENSSIKLNLEKLISFIYKDTYNIREQIKDYIYKSFPVSEPIGNAIKFVFKLIEENLSLRDKSPFIELDIINEIKDNLNNFNKIIRKYSSCAILLPKINSHSANILKSHIIILSEITFEENWQIFHAALKFTLLHVNEDVFIPTSDIPSNSMPTNNISKYTCPFYDICDLDLRVTDSDICRRTPWKSYNWAGWSIDNEICWYGIAVRQTVGRNKLD